MGLSNELSCEAGSFSCCHLNPCRCFQSEIRGLFPRAGTLGCVVCHRVHQLLSRWPAAALPSPLHNLPPCWVCQPLRVCLPPPSKSSPPRLRVSAPPTGLGEFLFFISLVVGLPYSRFSVSSGSFLFLNCCCPSFGCARRHSVSTYPSILVRSPDLLFLKQVPLTFHVIMAW